ncbi:MAG TPA: hypothetical protein VF384_07140 [Planctomycetota bacterium]
MRRLSLLCLVLAGCATAPANRYGTFQRSITTSSPLCQNRFDEGLLLCYGFNHDEAVRRFEEALAADPDCAMAWWGIAHALGPNINAPLTDKAAALRAHTAAQKAKALSGKCSPVEQQLITAMCTRYADPPPDDRAPLDRAWAAAMKQVRAAFPNDPDVGALYAESLVDLSPWDYWTKAQEPKANTLEVLATLENVLQSHPNHPQAIHLYIHATEPSKNPEKALPAARRLAALAPGCGHLVHMPAHTYQRVGLYADAIESNLRGTEIDREYFAAAGPQVIYHFYMAHNQHFATWSAMYAGDSATALRMARECVGDLPAHCLKDMAPFCDGFLALPWHVMIRFGRWQEILAEPQPGAQFPIARAFWHYARGIAHVNLGDLASAESDASQFEVAAKAVPADAMLGFSPAGPALDVARHMLAGEFQFRSGKRAEGIASLRRAVELEDDLRYDEPSSWMTPVRHALGALLLESGDHKAAAAVYREDLARHADNGWSLHGLAEALRRAGDPEAETTDAAFRRAFENADVAITASCFCRKK